MGQGKRAKVWFLVKWEGYDEGSNTWEPQENLNNAEEAVAEFYKAHPDAPALKGG